MSNCGWIGSDGVNSLINVLSDCYVLDQSKTQDNTVSFKRCKSDPSFEFSEAFSRVDLNRCKCGSENCTTVKCVFVTLIEDYTICQPIASIEYFDNTLISHVMRMLKYMLDFQWATLGKQRLDFETKRRQLELLLSNTITIADSDQN